MTKNDETPTPEPRPAATVTFTATAFGEAEAAIFRRGLPSADVREEVVRVPYPDGTCIDIVRREFRCTFASVPKALAAAKRLPPIMRIAARVEAMTAVNERELVLLACYYIDGFLRTSRSRPDYVPLSYDELPRPDTFLNCTVDVSYLHRVRELESILGIKQVRSIYDLMAQHPDRPGSDFHWAGAIASLGAETAWRHHEEYAADVAEFEAEFNFDLELAEEQWRRYDAWLAEEAARMVEDPAGVADAEEAAWAAEGAAEGAAEEAASAADAARAAESARDRAAALPLGR